MIEEQGKKGTDAHKAAVVGDTVGDPFKDTSGPSLNILLKLMSVVALVIAPSIAMDNDAVAAYVNEQSNDTIEVVVPAQEEKEAYTVSIKTTDVNENTTVEVSITGEADEVSQALKNAEKKTAN
jgi:K(+)-stimulated pyrophosphate-energized sodium pump